MVKYLFVYVLAALLLTGCGGSGSDGTSNSSSAVSTSSNATVSSVASSKSSSQVTSSSSLTTISSSQQSISSSSLSISSNSSMSSSSVSSSSSMRSSTPSSSSSISPNPGSSSSSMSSSSESSSSISISSSSSSSSLVSSSSVSSSSVSSSSSSLPLQVGGWTDFTKLLVASDGSHSIGTPTEPTRRDSGTKVVFFDTEVGDNVTGEAYFWDGENIIDTRGSTTNINGAAYGTNPFQPNANAIKPLRYVDGDLSPEELDPRVRVAYHDFGQMAAGFPDWFLFRRGQSHQQFTVRFEGGRSQEQPMLVGGYGPKSDGRAIIDPITSNNNPELRHPFYSSRNGQTPIYQHMVLTGLDIVDEIGRAHV